MGKFLKSPYVDAKQDAKAALKRYQDIESGRVLPTFVEFFKICILFEMAESVNLKTLYPTLYQDLKAEIDGSSKEIKPKKKK